MKEKLITTPMEEKKKVRELLDQGLSYSLCVKELYDRGMRVYMNVGPNYDSYFVSDVKQKLGRYFYNGKRYHIQLCPDYLVRDILSKDEFKSVLNGENVRKNLIRDSLDMGETEIVIIQNWN